MEIVNVLENFGISCSHLQFLIWEFCFEFLPFILNVYPILMTSQ